MALQFTESVTTAIEKALQLATQNKQTQLTEDHLLLSFLEDPQGYFETFAKKHHLNASCLTIRWLSSLSLISMGKGRLPSCIRIILAASSIKSMALSGKKRSEM